MPKSREAAGGQRVSWHRDGQGTTGQWSGVAPHEQLAMRGEPTIAGRMAATRFVTGYSSCSTVARSGSRSSGRWYHTAQQHF